MPGQEKETVSRVIQICMICMRIRITLMPIRIRILPFYFNADPVPDPACPLDADPDPVHTCHFDADPKPSFHPYYVHFGLTSAN